MSERILVTSALPYANGSIHLGHMVEHVQTDVYVRFRRAIGDDVTWICAADAHGTPIEVNAAKAGMSPREFSEKYRAEHHAEFTRFGIGHDIYYTTDSPENERWAHRIYDALKAKGLIYKRAVEQLYCEKDRRFLPDRYVRGTCPKCGTPDQYGDVCENCGTTYDPRDLVHPRCAICGTPPVVRTSDHAYVDLKKVEPLIRGWVEAEGHLEPSVREQVKGWLSDLQDWCITRDAPYFGFPVKDPEFAGKFFYVWMDAPIGYLSSAERWFAAEAPPGRRLAPDEFVRRYLAEASGSRLEHFIGKDILRFHAVFWPVMLWAAGLRKPDRMPVHGFLTVNGEKMSKTRGTFILLRTYLESGLDPQLLRYYFAANLGPGVGDLDLSLDEFRNRVNADLANNIANLASRVHALVRKEGEGPLAPAVDEAVREVAVARLAEARARFLALEYRDAIRAISELASQCNKLLQDRKPWEAPGAEETRRTLYSVGKAIVALARALSPVMPAFAQGLATAFGVPELPSWTGRFDPFDGSALVISAEKPPQIARLDAKAAAKLVVSPPAAASSSAAAGATAGAGAVATAAARSTARATPTASATSTASSTPGVVTYDHFSKVDLRVGVVLSAEPIPKADKLLKLSVDIGEQAPRTIAAGIAQAYPDPKALVGRRIVVVSNLEPRAIRGVTSHGMLLAAGEAPNLSLVTVGDGIAPGTRVK